jgi:hypothetical protein
MYFISGLHQYIQKEKFMIGHMIIEQAKSFYSVMKITGMCTFSEFLAENFVYKQQLEEISKWNTLLISCAAQAQE